jgi:hypothetical protein
MQETPQKRRQTSTKLHNCNNPEELNIVSWFYEMDVDGQQVAEFFPSRTKKKGGQLSLLDRGIDLNRAYKQT